MGAESDLNWSILGLGRFGRITKTLQSVSESDYIPLVVITETLEQHAKELQLANTTTSSLRFLLTR